MSFLNLMRNRLKPKEVNDALMDVEGRVLPVTTSATTGQILKLTGEGKVPNWGDEYSYTPPAYSETEVNTGVKWTDNRDIYRKVYSGTFPEIITTTSQVVGNMNGVTFINGYSVIKTTLGAFGINRFPIVIEANGDVSIIQVTNAYSESEYILVLEYAIDPAPETRDDDTETKKTTRKKTTK